jgi:hypothetical protein
MTLEEKYIARIMLKNKILSSDGQAYENLFCQIMRLHNPNFQAIKPQGSFGDRKNDGFDKTTGTYYQVYAPENIKIKERDTIKKLVTDFEGLYKYWNEQVASIKKFHYVVNDKYKGIYPTLAVELTEIEKAYSGVIAKPFLSKDLEDICLELSDDKIMQVIGFIPNPANFSIIEPTILAEVISFVLDFEVQYSPENIPNDPDFDKKIQFNNLSKNVKRLLDNGRIQGYILDRYFNLNSNFTKDELRNKFTYLYSEAIKNIETIEDKSDLVFFKILKDASPKQTKAVQDAVLLLMAYYFEYCDIFETPPSKD